MHPFSLIPVVFIGKLLYSGYTSSLINGFEAAEKLVGDMAYEKCHSIDFRELLSPALSITKLVII